MPFSSDQVVESVLLSREEWERLQSLEGQKHGGGEPQLTQSTILPATEKAAEPPETTQPHTKAVSQLIETAAQLGLLWNNAGELTFFGKPLDQNVLNLFAPPVVPPTAQVEPTQEATEQQQQQKSTPSAIGKWKTRYQLRSGRK